MEIILQENTAEVLFIIAVRVVRPSYLHFCAPAIQ